jgi:alcohol dehydrogenase (NADP+)
MPEIDPARIPVRILNNSAAMPAIGLGTFGSDAVSAAAMATAVHGAAEVGYRHFDCAAVYGNEPEIGRALSDIRSGGVPRDELWITSKLWNDSHGEDKVADACRRTLDNLGLSYLDLYLVHWPFPNHHPPGCDGSVRTPDARPYVHVAFMRTWRRMEQLVARGLVRGIGTSNMTIPKLRLLLRDAEIPPVVNQMELHPHFQQPELFDWLMRHHIQPVGYCPIGSPGRPTRDRSPEDTVDIEDPVIVRIARRRGMPPASVCVQWQVQRGAVPIPMSTRRANYRANLHAVLNEPLTDAEMTAIAAIDRNCRLIKGQVFTWPGAQGWEDLWDPDGVIPECPEPAEERVRPCQERIRR